MKVLKGLIYLIFFFLISLPIITHAASNWTVQEIKELKAIYSNPDDIEIIDLEFQTENHGCLIAKASNGLTYVYRTSDGGKNWSQVFTPLVLMKYKDIVFDETGNFGLILYDETRVISGWPDFQTVLIQGVKVTTNGGTNWTSRPFPGNHGYIWGVEARWPSYIWAVGEISTILYSSNYGQNWNPITSPVTNKTFWDIYVDPDDMVYGGGWGVIFGSSRLYASDAQYGGNWNDVSANIPWMDTVDFVMSNGVGIRDNSGQTGTIYYSGYPPGGGVWPWTGATLPEALVPSDVDMVTTWQGWVAGRNAFGKIEGKIYKTVNYGQTWSIDLEADDLLILFPNWTGSSTLNTISMVNASVGYAAGDGYYLFKYRPCSLPMGHVDYCRDCGPCLSGQGDCDGDVQCQAGLTCAQDVGAQYGMPWNYDVCEQPPGNCSVFQPGPDWCRDCGPCAEGEGDCDSDAECEAGLICAQDVGANYGWPAGRDVCEQPPGNCSVFQPGPDWCRDCGPCAEGEGDCDSDAEC
ncbi:MAG: hypothetical protein HF974_06085, partial [ANME-2 cluster archaeon]|nr:hypothetical protein [ANME-2 cluster archaeon]